jgi:hypothetical protein
LDVVVLQVFVSLMLALGSVLLFVHSAKQRDHEHSGRLALLPLEAEPSGADESSGAAHRLPAAERTHTVERGGNRVSEPPPAHAASAPGEKE